MDARTLFLSLHRHAHSDDPATLAGSILSVAPELMRIVPPGHNSIAWLLWHIARGEDWGVNAMMRGREEVLRRDDWGSRMGVPRLDFGAGMTEAEVQEFSRNIDLDALKAYHRAVVEETRTFLESFDFDHLDDPFDARARLAQIPETIATGGDLVRAIAESKTTKRWFLTIMALLDVELHFGEAQHVLRIVGSGRYP